MNRRNANRKQTKMIYKLVREHVENKPHAARFFFFIAQILKLPFYETNSRGTPAFHRPTMVALILYALFKGQHSVADIHSFAENDLGAIWILGEIVLPSEKTLERIIDDMLDHIESIFAQVLSLCEILELIGKERMHIDGTKTKANASKHKAMSHAYLCDEIDKVEEDLAEMIQEFASVIDSCSELSDDELEELILTQAREVYNNSKYQKQSELRQKEFEVFGGNDHNTELPPANSELIKDIDVEQQQDAESLLDVIGFRSERLKNMKEAKDTLETEWTKENGDKPIPEKTQVNFTDPESAIMVTKHHGVQQCYNNFALVDDRAYIVIGAFTTNTSTDKLALIPTLTHAQKFVELEGVTVGADAGFFSATNIKTSQEMGIDFFVSCPEPTGQFDKVNFIYDAERDLYLCPEGQELLPGQRVKSDAKTVCYKTEACKECPSQNECTSAQDGIRKIRRDKEKDPLREEARAKAASPEGREVLRERKGVAEPVWGNLLLQDGLNQHHYRTLDKAGREFKLRCVMHNLRKIFKAFANRIQTRNKIMGLAAPPRVA